MDRKIQKIDTPILIVGAGPVGLSLALDLASRGIHSTIVEQGDGSISVPRAFVLGVRTMEFLRRLGIAERTRMFGFPDDYTMDQIFCTSMTGHILEREPYPPQGELKPPPESPERREWCPQNWFDPLLIQTAQTYPEISLRFQCRFKGVKQDAEGVSVTASDLASGETLDIDARYLVGCDGAASQVREQLDIGLDGDALLGYAVSIFFRSPNLVEILASNQVGKGERYMFLGETGLWGNVTVLDGRELWRLILLGGKERFDLERFDPSAAVRDAIGSDNVPFEILGVRPWRRSQLLARDYRRGRSFIAGDAAHTMSPTGGFGMNTGIQDVINLGWKLEAVLKGWGEDALLDSYAAECRPVAQRAADASTGNFRYWVHPILSEKCPSILDDTKTGEECRREVGSFLRKALYEEWDSLGIQLGFRFENSPICVPDGSLSPPDHFSVYTPSARPGSRAPHAWLGDGRSTLDLFGKEFVLLRFGEMPPSVDRMVDAARQRGVPLSVVDINDAQIGRLYERRLVMVRPDGHSAWRADEEPADALAVIDALRGGITAELQDPLPLHANP